MASGDLLTIFLIVLGICLFVMAILSLAKRKMTEPFCLAWACVSVLLVICGILIEPSELERYISLRVLILILLITIGVGWILWFISTQISILRRRNQEIAMQISLLNQDSERMMKKLEDLEKRMYEDTSEGTDLQK
nr:hypothetical protein [uncultured Blautia sp.]